MTSVLLEKEKDTVILELLKRLSTNRGIDLSTLKVLDEVGNKVDTNLTVGESKLVFIELLDKDEKEKKKEKKKKKKRKTRGETCECPTKIGTDLPFALVRTAL